MAFSQPSNPRPRRSFAERSADYFGMSGPAEFITAAGLFALMIAFKIVNITRYRFNTDEAAHLHVIWAWARGFVQYRDIFDNHMPLFQIMSAPIFGVIGDRATILYWMRFILLPMYFVAAWCTYRIGTLLFSKRAGVWAVILAGLYPGYHFVSLEFRTDNLWAPLWLLSMLVLLNGAITVRRALVAGLLVGLCFGVSMKTTLLFVSLVASVSLTLFLVGRTKLGVSWGHLTRCLAAFLASSALIPAIIMLTFALHGIWNDFRYGVFDHNLLPETRNHPAWWIAIFPIAFPLVIFAARLIIARATDPALAFRRGFVFIFCGFYISLLCSVWTQVTRQDYLPYHPLAFVIYSGALLAVSMRLGKQPFGFGKICSAVPLPAFLAGIEFFIALGTHPIWIDRGKSETDLLQAVLQLTKPSDFVLDKKGETVFRQRCFQPVFEALTLERIRLGLMFDNAAQRCIDTRTCVTTAPEGMSLAASQFVERNYLPVGNGLRVVGAFLQPSPHHPKRLEFEIVIPASYKIIARDPMVTGMLDATPYHGARFLAPGKHTFVPTSNQRSLVVIWAQAADRNFTPFNCNTAPDT